jgi:hypothetical protein
LRDVRRPLAPALAAAAAAALAWPAAAGASGAAVIDGVLRIFSGPGEANRIVVAGEPGGPFRVRDSAALGAGTAARRPGPAAPSAR